MTQNELLGTGIYSAVALLLGIVVVLGLAVMLQVDRLIGRWVALSVVPAMGLGIALSSLLSGRDLKYAYSNIEAMSFGGAQGGAGVLRVITIAMVAASAATVVSLLFRPSANRERMPGKLLFIAFLAYYACNAILNAAFGTVPAFSHNTLYVPIAVAAVFMWRGEPVEPFVRAAKWMLMAFMAVSLIAAVAKPELAVQPGYKGWLPGLSFRLWGVGSNPNSIGPMALMMILLELMVPSSRMAMRLLAYAMGAAVLLLAQSKTAWVAAVAIVPILGWYRFGRAPTGGMTIGFALSLIAGLLILGVTLALIDPGRVLDKLAASQIGSDVSTLTGRLQIWAAAIRAWQENPVFGYGPLAWGPEHRAAIGLPFAFSAHNQFLQSLSAAGTLGLISLLAYLGVMAVYSFRAADATRGIALALFVLVFLRCLTEVPFAAATLFNGDMLTQLLLFRIVLLGARRQPSATHDSAAVRFRTFAR